MSEKLLEVNNLSVQYVTGEEVVRAVNGISFSLERGQTLGLVGETGAGKTTTALSILRLLPKYTGKVSPDSQIIYDGVNLLGLSEREMRKIRGGKISMIFQDPMTSLDPVITVGDQIAEVLKNHTDKKKKADINQEVGRILEMVGIPAERMTEYPHQFSGGMKQRVMIAIAIACNPQLLLADEPTTALDVTIQAQVLNMMQKLKEQLNSALILITHDLGVVASICDIVGIMYAGELVEFGTLEDVFDASLPHHPYTVGLFGSIPNLTEKTQRLSPIDGLMPDPTNLPTGCKFHDRCASCTQRCVDGEIPVVTNGTHKIKCILMQDMAEEGGAV